MIRTIMSAFLVAAVSSCASIAVSENAEIAALQRGMPAPISNLIERIVICNHFGGEESGGSKSDEEIQQADLNERQFRCRAVRDDEASARTRYMKNPSVQQRLTEADELLL